MSDPVLRAPAFLETILEIDWWTAAKLRLLDQPSVVRDEAGVGLAVVIPYAQYTAATDKLSNLADLAEQLEIGSNEILDR